MQKHKIQVLGLVLGVSLVLVGCAADPGAETTSAEPELRTSLEDYQSQAEMWEE